jgi:protoporphyrinogen/coproporphyrinogen III oxidase
MPRIVIVGAGVSGLSLAHRLRERIPDADLRILESGDRPGGTAWTERQGGWSVELGPNGFLDNKPTTLGLARDLGLGSRLVAAAPSAGTNRYLVLDRRLERLPGGPGDLLRTPLLSWRGKLALLGERLRRGKTDDGDESIDAFARRRAGAEVADTFADGLVTGIYAGDPKMLSLPACFPRVAEMERRFGSVMKGFAAAAKERRRAAAARGEPPPGRSAMWSFAGGMRTLVDALAERQPPTLGVAVRALRKTGDPAKPTWTVIADGRDSWEADAVVLTCPTHRQAEILADVDAELSREIGAIAYNAIAVLGLGYRREDVPHSLDGFGFIVPERLRRDLLGVQWCSSIFAGRAPDGMVLLRAMCGGWHRADMVSWDESRIVEAVRAELRTILGIEAAPAFHLLKRWQPGIPQYHLGHLDRLRRIDAAMVRQPGLVLSGNGYRGVALNDCVEQAEIVSRRIASYLREAQG